MAKKVKLKAVEEDLSAVIDVNKDVTSSSDVVDVPKSSRGKVSNCKKVEDVAFEDLQYKYGELKSRYDAVLESMSGLSADNERLCDELGTAVSDNKSLHKELSKLRQDFKRVQGDNRANSALVETLNDRLAQSTSSNQSLSERIELLQDEVQKWKKELSKSEEFNSISEKELKRYKSMTVWQRIKYVFVGTKMFDPVKK